MGKRSDMERLPKDKYYTWDKRAYPPLMPHLKEGASFAEPCAGKGYMVEALREMGLQCLWRSDKYPYEDDWMNEKMGVDALNISPGNLRNCDYIITNPPWKRDILHEMIKHFASLKPTWLLFDANWMFTKQAVPYLSMCEKIVNVGRLKWIPDSDHTGKDDCCWYHFNSHYFGPTEFYNG